MTLPRRLLAISILGPALILGAGCTADHPAQDTVVATSAPQTLDDLLPLAQVLSKDADTGNATFDASFSVLAADGETQQPVVMTGEVAWVDQEGTATLRLEGSSGEPAAQVQWTVESLTFMNGGVEMNAPTEVYEAVKVIASLAAKSDDNVVLVQQGGGTKVGSDTVSGRPVNVFDYQSRRFFVDVETGVLLRFESALPSGSSFTVLLFPDGVLARP